MRLTSQIKIDTLVASIKSKLPSSYSTQYKDSLGELIKSYYTDTSDLEYNTWIEEDKQLVAYILLQMRRKDKYLSYFSTALNTELSKITKTDGSVNTNRKVGTTNKTTTSDTHGSDTTLDYTSHSTSNDKTTMTDKGANENSPLGYEVGQFDTPYEQSMNTQNGTEDTTNDRTDKHKTNVNSTSNGTTDIKRDITDDGKVANNQTVTETDPVEILKALKYLNFTMTDVITDILDRTIYELNEVN